MSAAPVRKGWCPGALRPMMSGDGLLVRLRPPMGRLTPDQAMAVADLSARYGNGFLDLTSRANLQLRGANEETYPALLEELQALGLVDPNAKDEAARNVVTTPFGSANDETLAISNALAEAISKAPELPGKFGYALDTGPKPVLRNSPADIRIERKADGGLIVVPDGLTTGAPTTITTLSQLVLDLAKWFASSGGTRMAKLIASGAKPPEAFTQATAATNLPQPPSPGLYPNGALVGLAFGQATADQFRQIAELGPLRMTPWRMVLIEGLTDMPDLPGLITRADDPIRKVIACPGAPACAQARGSTRDLARQLAPNLTGPLHISGCAKGCAHPGAAPMTLVASGTGYDLIVDGCASDVPVQSGLNPETLINTPSLLTKAAHAP